MILVTLGRSLEQGLQVVLASRLESPLAPRIIFVCVSPDGHPGYRMPRGAYTCRTVGDG